MKKKQSEEQFISEALFGQRHELLSPFNKSEKGSPREITYFSLTYVGAAPGKPSESSDSESLSSAPFGSPLLSLVMGLRGGPVQGAGFSPWSGSYKIPHAHRQGPKVESGHPVPFLCLLRPPGRANRILLSSILQEGSRPSSSFVSES